MWYDDYRTVEQYCDERRRTAATHRLLKEARSSEVPMGLLAPAWLWVRSRLAVWPRRVPLRGRSPRVAGPRVDPQGNGARHPASIPRSTR